MSDHRSDFSRPLALVTRVRIGRCFRTASDGRIPLTGDWAELLRAARRLGPVALQTRHACARFIVIAEMPALTISRQEEGGHDESGALHCHFSDWGVASGYLRACTCCASPARLELRNRHGAEFMQLCGLPESSPLAWSDFFAEHCRAAETGLAWPAASSSTVFGYMCLARSLARFPFRVEALTTLFEAFGDERVPLLCTLRTSEVVHRREIVPSHLSHDGTILSAGEDGARLQIALPTVHAFALTCHHERYSLHLLGTDDAVILTLAAGTGALAETSWHGALFSLFPSVA